MRLKINLSYYVRRKAERIFVKENRSVKFADDPEYVSDEEPSVLIIFSKQRWLGYFIITKFILSQASNKAICYIFQLDQIILLLIFIYRVRYSSLLHLLSSCDPLIRFVYVFLRGQNEVRLPVPATGEVYKCCTFDLAHSLRSRFG